MLSKSPHRKYDIELRVLYRRRATVLSLIRSLECYYNIRPRAASLGARDGRIGRLPRARKVN